MIVRTPDCSIVIDGYVLTPEDVQGLAKFFEMLDAWDREGAVNDDEEGEHPGARPRGTS